MHQRSELAHAEPLLTIVFHPAPDRSEVSRKEILRVLERAAADDAFIARLTYHGSEALQDYDLTQEDEAALLSGDIRWLEAHVGKLDPRLRTWPECRLQQEIW